MPFPDELSHLSTCKSPHAMLGALVKSYYAEKLGMDPKDLFVVSVMPCTAKKYEIQRPELSSLDGVPDVDAVLTTRELARMIKSAGIDLRALPEGDVRRAAGPVHGRGGHLRRDRRRDGGRPAHRVRAGDGPRAAL